MPGWSITTWSLQGAATTVPISGTNGVLSGTAVFLEFDDTNVGGQNFRWNDLNKTFFVTWFNGATWQTLGRFTDPTTSPNYWELVGTGLSITGLAIGPANVFRQFVGVEANPRIQWDTNGKIDWGAGGASAVDVTLQRIAAATLQVTGNIRGSAAPSNVADLTRKDYVDTQVATAVPKAGGTMTGALILSGDPTTALGAATKQYVDASGTGATTFAAGAVLFGQGTKIPAVDTANFFWDGTNHRLGLGNNAPATLLDIANGTITLRQAGGNYSLTWANPAAARAISIPDPGGADSFVFAAMTQALTGKTLTGNIAVTLGPTLAQQHTLPAVASDTFALIGAAQTLLLKTLTTPVLTSPSLTSQSPASSSIQSTKM